MDNQLLKNYFNFDDNDINANRTGRLSDNQMKNFIKNESSINKTLIMIGSLTTLIALIFPAVFLPQVLPFWQSQQVGKHLDLVAGPTICFFVFAGLSLLIFRGAFRNRNEIAKLVLKKAEGPIHLVPVNNYGTEEIGYDIKIGNKKLGLGLVDDNIQNAIKDGDVFCVYYFELKDGTEKKLLSMEWLKGGDPH